MGRRKHFYFDSPQVEALIKRYQDGGCTDVALRNEIMDHAPELIRQVMLTYRLHLIYPRADESAAEDLQAAAWVQIERSLYKFEALGLQAHSGIW